MTTHIRQLKGMQGATAFWLLASLLPLSLWGQTFSISIYSAIANSANNQITVVGVGFGPQPGRGAPSVSFNGASLTLVSFTDTTIVANLPAGLVAGTYHLAVTNSGKDSAYLDVALGDLWGRQAPPSSISIYSAKVNSTLTQVTVVGVAFSPQPVRGAPSVSFDDASLTLVPSGYDNCPNLPASVAAGSYLLTVTNSRNDSASLDVTIGNQGPAGPIGLQGPIGLTGAAGAKGPLVQQGRQGQRVRRRRSSRPARTHRFDRRCGCHRASGCDRANRAAGIHRFERAWDPLG